MVAVAQPAAKAAADKQALPQIKQYREADGLFYFKLTTHQGALMLQSSGLADGREAGNWVKRLKTEGEAALAEAPVSRAEGVDAQAVSEALVVLVEATRQAEAEKAAKAAQA
jgi:tryptophanyl-tRNA synthetase